MCRSAKGCETEIHRVLIHKSWAREELQTSKDNLASLHLFSFFVFREIISAVFCHQMMLHTSTPFADPSSLIRFAGEENHQKEKINIPFVPSSCFFQLLAFLMAIYEEAAGTCVASHHYFFVIILSYLKPYSCSLRSSFHRFTMKSSAKNVCRRSLSRSNVILTFRLLLLRKEGDMRTGSSVHDTCRSSVQLCDLFMFFVFPLHHDQLLFRFVIFLDPKCSSFFFTSFLHATSFYVQDMHAFVQQDRLFPFTALLIIIVVMKLLNLLFYRLWFARRLLMDCAIINPKAGR